jgi:prephenate dehydrogenase
VSLQPARRIAIVGVGLIGGSCALAWRRAGVAGHIVGVGRGRTNLERALGLGVIDEIASDTASGVSGAEVVLVAVPVGQLSRVLAEMLPALSPGVLVTDAGSTKQDVVAAARDVLGPLLPRFVPAHPIAGAERSGVEAARAELYNGRNVVLTPLPETDPAALADATRLWAACGARVSTLSPERHDAVFAAVSHLPHALAFALVDMIARRGNAEQLFGYAAGGFRDFTRIASSSPEMWRDICMANHHALLSELDEYVAHIAALREAVAAGDAVRMEDIFGNARRARDGWLRSIEDGK